MIKDNIDPNIIRLRHQGKDAIRNFFHEDGFLEIDPPYLLNANTPDPYIDPLLVQRQNKQILQLHTSPEIWLKKALGYGFDKIYHMGRVFRDDIATPFHNVEFTMLEWYRAN